LTRAYEKKEEEWRVEEEQKGREKKRTKYYNSKLGVHRFAKARTRVATGDVSSLLGKRRLRRRRRRKRRKGGGGGGEEDTPGQIRRTHLRGEEARREDGKI